MAGSRNKPGNDQREDRYIQSIDEIPADELAEIRENIAWFLRFTPLQRIRIAESRAAEVLRLRRMKRVEGGR